MVRCGHCGSWPGPDCRRWTVMINFEISRKPRVAAVTCHQQAAVLIATHLVGLSATNFTIINNNIYQHQGGRGVSVARRKNQKHRQMLCSMQLPIKLLNWKYTIRSIVCQAAFIRSSGSFGSNWLTDNIRTSRSALQTNIFCFHKQSQDKAQGRQMAGKKQIHHCKYNNNTLVAHSLGTLSI